MNERRSILWLAELGAMFFLVAPRVPAQSGTALRPGIHYMRGAAAPAGPVQQNMTYNGGLLLPNTTTYAIWWGNPSDFPPDAVEGVDELLEGLDGSSYLAIADQYMFGQKTHTHFGGNLFDPTPPPIQDPLINDLPISNEVYNVLQNYGMKTDPNAVYLVYTSNFVLNSVYCAFHDANPVADGSIVHFAYIPNSANSSGCQFIVDADPFLAPNNASAETRGFAILTSHEFMEGITDPEFNGWHDANYVEVGDPCEFIFNDWVQLTDSRWKLPTIWSNKVRGCAQAGAAEMQILGALSAPFGLTTFDPRLDRYGMLSQGINVGRTVVGYYFDTGPTAHGFLRNSNGTLTTIDGPGAAIGPFGGTAVFAINDWNATAGNSIDANGTHGFVRDALGNFTVFDAPGAATLVGTVPYGINDAGATTGWFMDSGGSAHGFLRDVHGNITVIDAPGAGPYGTYACVINGFGAITGYSTDANFVNHSYVRDASGNFTTFSFPGASGGTFAFSINDAGAAAGYYVDSRFVKHGFIRGASGNVTTFDAPGAAYGTVARSINDFGFVAGYYSDATGTGHGFVRDPFGHFTTFASLANAMNALGATGGHELVPKP